MTSVSQTQNWTGWCCILQCPLMTTKNTMTNCHSVRPALDGAKKWCPNRQLVMAQLCLRLKKIQSVQRNHGFGVLQTIFLTYQFFSQPLDKLSSSLFRDTVWAGAWSGGIGGWSAPVLQGYRLDLRPETGPGGWSSCWQGLYFTALSQDHSSPRISSGLLTICGSSPHFKLQFPLNFTSLIYLNINSPNKDLLAAYAGPTLDSYGETQKFYMWLGFSSYMWWGFSSYKDYCCPINCLSLFGVLLVKSWEMLNIHVSLKKIWGNNFRISFI